MEWRVVLPLLVTVVCYIGLGGFLFYVIEASNESNLRTQSVSKNQVFLRDHPCVSPSAYWLLVQRIVTEQSQGVLAISNFTLSPNWDIGSSIFFAGTLVTTVGYGHISPLTFAGRVFCVFYALFGIPVTMLMLMGCGSRMGRLRDTTRASAFLQTIITLIIGLTFFFLIPVVMFMRIEGWSYTDSLYFGFITLSSVGFGDLVPGQRVNPSYQGWYRLVTVAWIFIGMIWLSTLFTMLSDAFKGGYKSPKKPQAADPQQPVVVVRSEAHHPPMETLELAEVSPRSRRVSVAPSYDALVRNPTGHRLNGGEAEVALRNAVQEAIVARAYQEMAAQVVDEMTPQDVVAAAVTSAVLTKPESGLATPQTSVAEMVVEAALVDEISRRQLDEEVMTATEVAAAALVAEAVVAESIEHELRK